MLGNAGVWLSASEPAEDFLDVSGVVEEATEQTNFLIEWLMSQRGAALEFAKKLVFVIFIYFVGRWVIRLLLKLMDRMMKRREVDLAVQNFVLSFSRVAFFFLLLFIMAGMLGIGATVVAIVGSAGLAIGLALQGSLSNLAGGILILLLKPFTVGDYVVVTGVEGTVLGIDIFYTKIKTLDNKMAMIPNGAITGADIINVTKAPERMLQINFFVDFVVDLDILKEELLYLMKEDDFLLQEKPMETVILKLGVNKIELQLRAWTKQEDYWAANERMSEKIQKLLNGMVNYYQ